MSTQRQPYAIGPSPYELKPIEVIRIVEGSTSRDWVYDPDSDIYSYCPNLLIRMEGTGSGGSDYTIYFGTQIVASAQVEAVVSTSFNSDSGRMPEVRSVSAPLMAAAF